MSDAMDKSSELSSSSQMLAKHMCPNHTRIAAEAHTMKAQQVQHAEQLKEIFDRLRELEQLAPAVKQLVDQVKAQADKLSLQQSATQALSQQVDRAEAASMGFRNGVCEAQKDINELAAQVNSYTPKLALQEQQTAFLSEKLTERTSMFWRIICILTVSVVLSGLCWVVDYTFKEIRNQAATVEMLRTTIQETFKALNQPKP